MKLQYIPIAVISIMSLFKSIFTLLCEATISYDIVTDMYEGIPAQSADLSWNNQHCCHN